MVSELMLCLMKATLAASTAIVLVGLLRKPIRRALGARAAYLIWLLVPSSVLAVVLPAPSQPVAMAIAAVPHPVHQAVGRAILVLYAAQASFNYLALVLLAWLAGVGALSVVAVRRQRSFVRSLGRLSSRADGTYRSPCGLEPLLVGFWRPRIVLPADFEARYTPEEASWVLAHERAHLQRGDALVNAVATGWLCVFWFNPLMYLAVGWLRFDQDLAADALVLAAAGTSPRGYANALLKTQLISDSPWRLPVGCQWQSSHPLKERIGMLRRPLPGIYRRCLGVSTALALIVCSVGAAWVVQPARGLTASGTPIAIQMKWLLNGADLLRAKGPASTADFLVTEGIDFVRSSTSAGHIERIRCVVSLPGTQHASRVWNVPGTWQKFRKAGHTTDGVLLVQCIWRENGRIVMQPSFFLRGGEPAAAEVADGVSDRRLEFKAATSPTAALKAAPPAILGTNRPGKWRFCLVTTSCWALTRKTPPRVCPAGAPACAPRAARVIPLALQQRPVHLFE